MKKSVPLYLIANQSPPGVDILHPVVVGAVAAYMLHEQKAAGQVQLTEPLFYNAACNWSITGSTVSEEEPSNHEYPNHVNIGKFTDRWLAMTFMFDVQRNLEVSVMRNESGYAVRIQQHLFSIGPVETMVADGIIQFTIPNPLSNKPEDKA